MQDQKENFIQNQILESSDTIDIKEELQKYLIHWKWFLIGISVSLSVAFIYLRYTTPQYSVDASILIKDNQKSGISQELAAFEDLGIIGGGSANNTDNEIYILKSRKIIGNVVDTLDLTTSYYNEGIVIKSEAYKKSPFLLEFIKKDESFIEKDTVFVISFVDKNNFEIKDVEGSLILSSQFNEIIDSKLGVFKVLLLEEFDQNLNEKEVIVSLTGRNKVIDRYRKGINISAVDKKSSVLNLSLQDVVKTKAEDILNELVKQYNIDAIQDKNIVSEKTRDFIEDRLKSVGLSLGGIQDDVKNYKIKFGITGLSKEGELALEAVSVNNQKIAEIQSQLTLAEWIQKKIKRRV
jgi:uncharacterized protein involved in exopolysaccharide biosynthesis